MCSNPCRWKRHEVRLFYSSLECHASQNSNNSSALSTLPLSPVPFQASVAQDSNAYPVLRSIEALDAAWMHAPKCIRTFGKHYLSIVLCYDWLDASIRKWLNCISIGFNSCVGLVLLAPSSWYLTAFEDRLASLLLFLYIPDCQHISDTASQIQFLCKSKKNS